MKIVPLGVGGAFTEKFYHNNFVFDFGERKLLVDAGTTLRYALKSSGYTETDITDIFITHLHSDHVGGLEELLQRCYWRENPHKPTLWVPHRLNQPLRQCLEAGLVQASVKFEDYFTTIQLLDDQPTVLDKGITIQAIDTSNLHIVGMISFAIKITKPNGENFLFTSDIGFIEESGFLEDFINTQTVYIFHDIQMLAPRHSVHAGVEQLLNYYPSTLYESIYLMHYGDNIEQHRDRLSQYGFQIVEQGVPILF